MSRSRASPGALFVNLLGGFEVTAPQRRDPLILERKKTRALLAVLALDSARAVPRGRLTALLWAEQSENAARHALRQCLLDLRQALTKANIAAIRAEADLIGLEPSMVVVDAVCFERKIAQGTPEALEEAVALYRGDLLEGFSLLEERAFEDWLRVERERLRSQAVAALKRLLGHHVRKKGSDAAIQAAIRLLKLESFDEEVHRTLMRLYADSGRRGAALRQYEECVEILSRELGAEPEPETRALYRSLVPDRVRPTSTTAPTEGHRRSTSQTAPLPYAFKSIGQTPLVGRGDHIEWLDSLRHRAFQGQFQQLLVIGEAGIGKSRLAEELAVRTRQHRGDVLLGRGREGESVLPFAPWLEALRPALSKDLVEHLPVAIRRDLGRLFSEIDDGPNSPSGGLEDGPRIFEAIAHLLKRLSVERPLAVVVEDLHWCDDMTIRLFGFLPRRLEGCPVLLLGTARPEEMMGDRRPAPLDMLSRDRACTVRTLGPLSRDETTQLFRALLTPRDETPSALLLERTWRLSEGNPFVVIECAKAVRDSNTADLADSLELPNQVRALTAQCFTRLSERAARLADVGAVIGRDFHAAVLRNATGLAESEVADGVEELVRRHILREMNGRFDFRHDRIREVGYTRLLAPRRALLHRQVAAALEATYAADLGPHLAAIGTHYRHAECWQEACDYLARSGFQAWNRGAGREALTCFEDALQAIAHLPDTDAKRALHVHLLLAANGAHAAVGSYERGRPHLLAAQHLASTLSDRRWAGRVAVALSNSHRTHGSLAEALRLAHSALEIAQDTRDGGLESTARFVLAHCELTVTNFRRSLSHLWTLLSGDARCPDLEGPFVVTAATPTQLRAQVRYLISFNYVILGEFDAAMRVIAESLREANIVDDPLGTSRMLANLCLGKLQTVRGDFDTAVQAFETALEVYKEDYHRNFYRPIGWGLGLAYALAGRFDKGVGLLERAEATEREIGSMTFRPMLLLCFGRALLAAGRIEDAMQAASGALKRAQEVGNRLSEAGAHGLLGEVVSFRDPVDLEAMERHVLDALALSEALEMRPLSARCHLRLAWLYKRTGHREQERHAAAAAFLLEQMGNPKSLDAAGIH